MSFIVAVDGPAGSGKGTITKRIKEEVGLLNLDTGATYRCVALMAIRNNLTYENEEQIIKLLDNIDIKIENAGEKDKVFLNGEDVTKEIRETPVTNAVSKISSIIRTILRVLFIILLAISVRSFSLISVFGSLIICA